MYDDLKQYMMSLEFVQDNEYLDKYVDIIQSNRTTSYVKKKSQRHHIIPAFYFKSKGYSIDNTEFNLVNLSYKDHVLAHYYLALAVNKEFVYQATVPINIILGHKNFPKEDISFIDKLEKLQLLYELSRETTCNPMFNETYKEEHDSIMRSQEVRTKISNTMKEKAKNGELFNSEHRIKLSQSAKGKIAIHKNTEEKHIKQKELETFLNDGWTQGGLPVPREIVERRSKSRACPVCCIDRDGNELARFDSVKSACEWWIKNGYTRKIPENIYDISNTIKESSNKNKYICDVKWIYLPKERKWR